MPIDETGRRESVFDHRDAVWAELGTVDEDVISHFMSPTFFGGPAWPTTRQAFLRVRRQGSVVLASDGLSDPYDEGHLAQTGLSGLGVEVFLETDDPELRADGLGMIDKTWAFELLYEMAQNAAYSGDLADRIDRLGAVSMELPGLEVGAGWQTDYGSVGLLMGVPAPDVRRRVDTPSGSVRMVAVTLLRPTELEHVITGRAAGRAEIARRLAASGNHHRCDLSRASVI